MRSQRGILLKTRDGATGQGIDWLAYLMIIGGLALFFVISPITNSARWLVLGDPDNYMRLVQVRDWLDGQSWWDTTQYRIGPPEGLKLHWSRLADVPLAALITLFAFFADRQTAEILAVVTLPPLLLFFTAIFLGRTARNLGGAPAESWARLLLVSATFVLVQFIPGRVDHHGLQLLLLAGALMYATAEPTRRSGLLVGMLTAVSLLIGLENVPLLLAIPAVMALTWLLGGGQERQAHLEGYATGIVVALLVLYALSVAPSDWGRATHDEIGRGHIAMVVAGGLSLVAALRLAPASVGWRMRLLAVVPVVAVLPLIAFPEVLSSPYSAVDPTLQRLWIEAISETKSAIDTARDEPAKLLSYYWFPCLALFAGAALYLRYERKPELLMILAVSLAGCAVSLWQLRGISSASLPALLLSATVGSHLWRHRAQRFGFAYIAAAAMLLNGWTGLLVESLIAKDSKNSVASATCEAWFSETNFDGVPPGLVLSGIDSSGLILARTSHSVLTASNHRAVDNNRQAYQMFLSSASEAQSTLARSKVDYVLLCRDNEIRRLAYLAPNSLVADLVNGRIPDWLVPLPHDGSKEVLFYAMARDPISAENPETPDRPGE